MKSGPENVRAVPHQSAADRSQGLTDEEKTLKQTRSRNGCIGTWRTDNACDPQRRIMVPWMREWMHRRRDKRRKACLERVASVKGRNIRICKAVDSLAVLETTLQRNQGFIMPARDKIGTVWWLKRCLAVGRPVAAQNNEGVMEASIWPFMTYYNKAEILYCTHLHYLFLQDTNHTSILTATTFGSGSSTDNGRRRLLDREAFTWIKQAFFLSKLCGSGQSSRIGWGHVEFIYDRDLEEVHF